MADNKNDHKKQLQSQIDTLTAEKQKHETFLKTNEPVVTEALKQFNNLNPEDFENQPNTQIENLHKYLKMMLKNPEIAKAKKQIMVVIPNDIDKLEKQILSL